MKRLGLAGLIAVGLGISGYLLLEGKASQGYVAHPTQVAVISTMEIDSAKKITGIGAVEAKYQVMVSAEVSGQISQINFTSGDWVKKGTLLIQLNDDVEQADKARLMAQKKLAELQLDRFSTLVKQKAGNQEQLDKAEAELTMVAGEISKVNALIAQKRVVAPFDGQVGIRRVHLGAFIVSGQPIVSLINNHELFANFTLDDKALPHLKIGQIITLRNSGGVKDYSAVITAIDPWIEQSGLLAIQADITNADDELYSGMYIRAELTSTHTAPTLIIPETGIAYSAYGNAVFVVSKGDVTKVERRRVVVGDRMGDWVTITEGLEKGTQVIISGQHKLQDQSLIEIVVSNTLQFELPQALKSAED